MTLATDAAAVTPRWLGTAWVWLPAAAGLALFGGVAVLQSGSGPGAWWWALAALACAGAYAVRERRPVAALAASLAIVAAARLPGVTVLSSGFDVIYLLLLFVPVLPLAAVASRLPPQRSWPALVATVAVTVAASPEPAWSARTHSAQEALIDYVLKVGVPVMIALGAWLAGCAVLAGQRHAEALLERAERARDADAARAVAEERTRIAQELHDVITHTVAVMVVQASAAGAVWDRDPAQARAALQAVEESGRTVMADLRGMLGAMRADGPAAERQARPGVEELEALADRIRRTGLTARLAVTGSPAGLAPLTSLALLRIAQESVTNALRHARASTIAIDFAVDAAEARLSVTDDGVGLDVSRRAADPLDPQAHGGHGLLGMRERARVIGGVLEVGPGAEGGTVVAVRAPLR